jgi:hypothetical protein
MRQRAFRAQDDLEVVEAELAVTMGAVADAAADARGALREGSPGRTRSPRRRASAAAMYP